jgi:SSS family solute:Na+ symporter
VAHANGHVTAADVVHGTYNSRADLNSRLITGMVATSLHIALQLIGMGVVIKAMGLTGELPIVAAFIILALYTYSSGLRAPALIAFVKRHHDLYRGAGGGGDRQRSWRYGAVFSAANDAFAAKGGATGLILKPQQMLPLCDAGAGFGARRLHVSAHSDRDFRVEVRRYHSQEMRFCCRPIRCCWV